MLTILSFFCKCVHLQLNVELIFNKLTSLKDAGIPHIPALCILVYSRIQSLSTSLCKMASFGVLCIHLKPYDTINLLFLKHLLQDSVTSTHLIRYSPIFICPFSLCFPNFSSLTFPYEMVLHVLSLSSPQHIFSTSWLLLLSICQRISIPY